MNDRELKDLLAQWKAPDRAPIELEDRIFGQKPWYRWLFEGSVRIPVPVLAVSLALFGAAVFYVWTSQQQENNTTRLADFQPVAEPKVRIIRSHYETH